jgi:kynurenine formamidase
MHTGTHIDAPMHLTDSRKYINEYGLDIFCGTAKVLDATGEPVISIRDSYNDLIQENDIVLFCTGHDEKYGTGGYFTDHPSLDMNVVEFLVEKKVRLIGLDMPSPDHHPYPVHKKLLENDIFLIENLRNLKKLRDKSIRLYAFPLNIRADASIVRVVAEIVPAPAG